MVVPTDTRAYSAAVSTCRPLRGLMGDPPARAILVILVRGKIGVGPIGGLPKGTRPVFVSSEAVGYRQAGYFDRTVRIGPKTDLKLHRPTYSLSLSLCMGT